MDVSIVVPLRDEEESLPELCAWILKVVTENKISYEIILVDDGSHDQTLPVALYSFFGDDVSRWNLICAGIVITIAPILAFYLFAQRHLIRGFSAGVKG